MARSPKRIDPEQVKRMAACGCIVEEMASVLGCHKRTLERRFAAVIDEGRMHGRTSLRHKQFRQAMRGDRVMLIWLGKQLLGQRDRFDTLTRQEAIEFGAQVGNLIND